MTCSTCRYYRPGAAPREGQCRRRAPQADSRRLAVWPTIEFPDETGCGEYLAVESLSTGSPYRGSA